MYIKYLVKDNDTFKKIADNYSIDVDTLMDINNIYFESDIRKGMELIIPVNSENYFTTYSVEKGDSLYKIAEKYNVNPTLLSALNGIEIDDYIYPNQEVLIPKGNYSYYITKEGDTLNMVSDIFKTDLDKLLKENKTIYLLPGQVLITKR